MNIEDLKNKIEKTFENVDVEVIKRINVNSIVDNVRRELKIMRLGQK